MDKYLIIQTAFIGDVVLATPLIEKIKKHYPEAQIDFLLRKGNEVLLQQHPHLQKIIIWNKKSKKLFNLIKIVQQIRKENYDYVINIQRFTSTGLLTAFSRAKNKIGFHNNPFSHFFTQRITHNFKHGTHEIDRNLRLIESFTNNEQTLPKLYPAKEQYQNIEKYKTSAYICIAPTSVWFTKQFPIEKWIAFCNEVPEKFKIYLLGAPTDFDSCEEILQKSSNKNMVNIAGKINLLESAALMESATMNFVNDSAPLHLCSAVNAPCTAIFCSTVPDFGFGPLSQNSTIIETNQELDCRPCGIHGFSKCPVNTFECAYSIDISRLLERIQ